MSVYREIANIYINYDLSVNMSSKFLNIIGNSLNFDKLAL